MIKYDMLPERIDIDIKGNIYVQKLPMEDRVGLLCPYAEELSTVCNIRCAKCSITLEDIKADNPLSNDPNLGIGTKPITKTCWNVTCCGTIHRAQLLYQQHHVGSMELQYHEVTKQYN